MEEDLKPIIVSGVDVSKCEFYCEEYCTLSNDRNERLPFAEKCTGYSDCCFKQLKRQQYYLEKIRAYELNSLDVDWDEYEQHACDCEYSPIIDFVELALGEKEDV